MIETLTGTPAGSKKLFTSDHPNNLINRDNGIDVPEAWILTVNITGDQYSSGPPERT